MGWKEPEGGYKPDPWWLWPTLLGAFCITLFICAGMVYLGLNWHWVVSVLMPQARTIVGIAAAIVTIAIVAELSHK